MEDLSLHLLDVVENSIRAGADSVDVRMTMDKKDKILRLLIRDNGCGMDEKEVENAIDPFYTTKKGKDFGLGISLLAQAAESTGGYLKVQSNPGEGTEISVLFHSDHADMIPLGDVELTMDLLKMSHGHIRFNLDLADAI